MSTLSVAIVQSDLHWHGGERNLAQFSEVLLRQEGEVDLFVLPEMFASGFTMDAEKNAESMDGPSVRWMAEISAKKHAAICGSLIIKDGSDYFNRFVLIQPDGKMDCYDKRHRFRLAGEHENYAAGGKLVTIEFKGWRIRPMVCYDLRFPIWSRNRDDYDLLIYVANWPDRRHLAWETLIRARAIENLAYVAAVNRIGTDGNGVSHAGGSAIIDYLGNPLVAMSDEPAVKSATLDKSLLSSFRHKFPFHLDADAFAITDQKAN